MTWAPGPVVTRRRLGGELKRLRVASGLLLENVAAKLECSPSKISRLENGKGIPKYRDVRDMLDAYGIGDGELREQLLEWSQTGQAPMWWRAYSDVLSAGLDTYVELEWDAARIQAYESHVVHGLLQTRDYARAVLGSASSGRSASEVKRLVEVRMKRQEVLGAEHGLDFHCVLDESALYRVVGSAETLRQQIEHLVDVAEAEHVEVRILPFAAGLVVGSLSSFAKLDFSSGIEHGLVHVESADGASFLADAENVRTHEMRLAALLDVALTGEESVPLMRRAAKRLTDTPEG